MVINHLLSKGLWPRTNSFYMPGFAAPSVVANATLAVGGFRARAARRESTAHVESGAPTRRLRAVPVPPPFSETVTRQFSLWPFGTRILKLYLLLDPSINEPAVMQKVLRAMREEFFRSEARSQTNALRSALLAGHFAIREWNQRQLAHERVTASVACAVTRGSTAYVVLAGEAAALSWDGDLLHSHRATSRVPRPLGGEVPPRVSFWSAPLAEGDRLVLTCGGGWSEDSLISVRALLREGGGEASADLPDVLAGPDGPARVLLAQGTGTAARGVADHPAVGSREPLRSRRHVGRFQKSTTLPGRMALKPMVAGPLGLGAMLLLIAALTLPRALQPGHLAAAVEAEQLLERASQARDPAEGRRLAAAGHERALQAHEGAPVENQALLERAERSLRDADRAYTVPPSVVVHLGDAGPRMADLVATADSLLMLDSQQGVVRGFDASGRDQPFGSGRVVLRAGETVSGGRLDTPVALAGDANGAIAVVDRSRALWIGPTPERVSRRSLSGAGQWKSLESIGLQGGQLLTLDAASRLLAVYPPSGGGPTMIGAATAPSVPFERAIEVVATDADLFVRTAEGAIHRMDHTGHAREFRVSPPDGPLGAVTGLATDRRGGLYLAEAGTGRIVHTTAEGRFIRQLRPTERAGQSPLRALQTSPRGDRLFYADSSAVLSVALPAELPTPL